MCKYHGPYDEIPVEIIRDGQTKIIMANELEENDSVYLDGREARIIDVMPDEDDGIFYITTDGVNMVPVNCCKKRG